MREINLLGLNLQDYTLREKMRMIDSYLGHGALGTVGFVSTKTLMQAGEDAAQKEWLESTDVVVYCVADILRAGGITARSRLKEIENNSFLNELMRRIARERRTVYLIADTQESMQILESDLEDGQVQIAGKYILQEEGVDVKADAVINDINDKVPNVVLTLSAYPLQAAFVFHNKSRINADLWVGLPKDRPVSGEGGKKQHLFVRKLQRKLFQRKVHQYENQEKTEN